MTHWFTITMNISANSISQPGVPRARHTQGYVFLIYFVFLLVWRALDEKLSSLNEQKTTFGVSRARYTSVYDGHS